MSQKWIFLRGLSRDRLHWGSFVEQFQAAFPEVQIECIDLPGAGDFNSQRAPFLIADFVRHIRSHSRLIQTGDKINLMSMSLGSMVAIKWAELFPEEIASAVLINTSFSGMPVYKRLKPDALKAFFKIALLKGHLERETEVLKLISSKSDNLKYADEFSKVNADRPVHPANFFRQLLAASFFRLPSRLKMPVLVLRSLGDKLADPSCSQEIGERLNLPIKTHPSAGHDLTLDDPEWVISHVAAFLAEKGLERHF